MTDKMGVHWKQPDRTRLFFSDTEVLIAKADFDLLADYSASIPSGVYPGKMWKCRYDYHDESKGWAICWFGPEEDQKCKVHHRRIVINEVAERLELSPQSLEIP